MRVYHSGEYVNIYCNKFHRYRFSHTLLESKSWPVDVVAETASVNSTFPTTGVYWSTRVDSCCRSYAGLC